ncbi:hypothetical protein GJ496_003053, partial [Pomphorhynchus laevis]
QKDRDILLTKKVRIKGQDKIPYIVVDTHPALLSLERDLTTALNACNSICGTGVKIKVAYKSVIIESRDKTKDISHFKLILPKHLKDKMSEGANQLIDKINSIPMIKELQDALTAASKQASDIHPMMKTVIESLIGLLTSLSSMLSNYSSYVDPYVPMATDAIKNLEQSYPSLTKSSTEITKEFTTSISNQIPDSIKQQIKSCILTSIKGIMEGLKKIKTSEASSIKDLVNTTLMDFSQVKDVINHATSLASNVTESETATKAAAASTEAILNQLGSEAKEKYALLPDATSKAQFIAEEGWKRVATQMTSVNEQISGALPEPFKSGYNAALSLVQKMSTEFNQKLPSNADMLKQIHVSIDTISKYLESLQKWLTTEEPESSSLPHVFFKNYQLIITVS